MTIKHMPFYYSSIRNSGTSVNPKIESEKFRCIQTFKEKPSFGQEDNSFESMTLRLLPDMLWKFNHENILRSIWISSKTF